MKKEFTIEDVEKCKSFRGAKNLLLRNGIELTEIIGGNYDFKLNGKMYHLSFAYPSHSKFVIKEYWLTKNTRTIEDEYRALYLVPSSFGKPLLK